MLLLCVFVSRLFAGGSAGGCDGSLSSIVTGFGSSLISSLVLFFPLPARLGLIGSGCATSSMSASTWLPTSAGSSFLVLVPFDLLFGAFFVDLDFVLDWDIMLWPIGSSNSISGASDANEPTDWVESREDALETRGFLARADLLFFPGG